MCVTKWTTKAQEAGGDGEKPTSSRPCLSQNRTDTGTRFHDYRKTPTANTFQTDPIAKNMLALKP